MTRRREANWQRYHTQELAVTCKSRLLNFGSWTALQNARSSRSQIDQRVTSVRAAGAREQPGAAATKRILLTYLRTWLAKSCAIRTHTEYGNPRRTIGAHGANEPACTRRELSWR